MNGPRPDQTFNDIWREIREELERALAAYPLFNSAHEGWAIIQEELDELWDVVREKQRHPGRSVRLRREATQVAAMAIRFLLEMNQFKN